MRFRSLIIAALCLGLVTSGLAGCGQKGPLVPPKSQVSPATLLR